MDKGLEQEVRRRASSICEYCQLPQSASLLKFVVDHVIARQHGGATALDNLALACGYCNRHKGPNIAGVDPQTGHISPLFNPRRDAWQAHFRREGTAIVGLTGIGRTTVAVLAMNHPNQIAVRQALREENLQ